MCVRSGWLVIGVFAQVLNTYVRTHGGVNGVVHTRGGGTDPRKPPPYTSQGCAWASYTPLGTLW